MREDFLSIRTAIIRQQKTPGGVQLSKKLQTEIVCTKNLVELLDTLADSPYWSWIDIRLLNTIVSEVPQALQTLQNYKNSIFSRKLIDVLPCFPSKEIKTECFTKIVTNLGKDPNTTTVADLLEFQSQLETVIMDIGQGICVLDHIMIGCIQVYFFIPTNFVKIAYQSASVKCDVFMKMNLMWLQIAHYPEIHNPLLSPKIIMPTLLTLNNAGK